MSQLDVEQRITALEDLLAEVQRLQANTQHELDLLARENRESRREWDRRWNESQRRWEESRAEWDRRRDEDRREWNKRWGELANKMGTLVEDIVAPSIPRVARQILGWPEEEPPEYFAVRVRVRHPADPNRRREFDVVAVYGDVLLLNEAKSSLDAPTIARFVEALQEARAFFPAYADKKIIGAVASLYVDESLVRYGESLGVIVLGAGEELVEVLNSPGFKPREF